VKTVIIVQARMTSTRLPGKILKKVLDKPLLEYQIERLRRVKLADEIVIATTVNDTDQPIIDLCNKLGVKYYRGSEEDVLSRYYYAALECDADIIVRVTSDCPLIDPQVIDEIIAFYSNNQQNYHYVANTLERTYPRGMDTEVFAFNLLEQSFQQAKSPTEREHVTPFIYNNPNYKLANVSNSEDQSRHRWTVDTEEDFILISKILTHLYPVKAEFTLEDIIILLEKNTEWFNINSHVEQKKIQVKQ